MAQGLPPGIAGFEAGRQADQRAQQGQIQLIGILSQLNAQQEAQAQAREMRPLQLQQMQGQLAKTQADQQREQQFRVALSALGPNPSPGALAQIAAQFSSPDKVLDIGQRAADRQVTQEGQLAIGRERMAAAQEAQAARALEARERQQASFDQQRSMAQLAAGLRQPRQEPAPTAVTVQDPNDPSKNIIIDARTRQVIGGAPKDRSVGSDKPMTEFQGRSSLFGTRMAQSDKVLRGIEENISVAGLASKQSAANVPIIGGALGFAGNLMLSPDQQRVEQAQRDFVNATLRQESGAVINPSEFENAQKQYFVQPGDSKAVIAQKRLNREIAISGFARMAGPGAEDIRSLQAERLLPALGNRAGARGAAPSAPVNDVRAEADKILGLDGNR